MAITRTPLVDDDGSGTTGTILNNALKTELYDQIDAAFGADLPAIGGLSTTGLIARTGAGTAATRTVTAGSANLSVTNGSGVSGNPTIDLAANPSVASVTLTDGHVAFPATQNASSNANTLDDYEEGTWTPVLGGATSTSGQSYTTQAGQYVKVGQLVFVSFVIVLSAKGTITGNLTLRGLPFAIHASSPAFTTFFTWSAFVATWVAINGAASAGSSAFDLRGMAAAATSSFGTDLATADIDNTSQLRGGFVYRATD